MRLSQDRAARHIAYGAGAMFGMSLLYGYQAVQWFSLKALGFALASTGAIVAIGVGCILIWVASE